MAVAAKDLRIAALALFVVVGSLTLDGCVSMMRGYVSSPTAEGGSIKSETELCVRIKSLDLCAKSAAVPDQFHLFFLGLYAGIPVPLLPMPYGIYEYFSPPEKKAVDEEIVLRLLDNNEKFSFDPMKVVLKKMDQGTLTPSKFECAVDELGYQRKFTSASEIPDTKGIYCRLTFDSHDWDFDLLVGGIETKKGPLDAPLIHFKRGIEQSWTLTT